MCIDIIIQIKTLSFQFKNFILCGQHIWQYVFFVFLSETPKYNIFQISLIIERKSGSCIHNGNIKNVNQEH